ncbi:MAG: class B sortase [Firmicutes bacterium]|nr:class B sortase [Bacillota bacterium]
MTEMRKPRLLTAPRVRRAAAVVLVCVIAGNAADICRIGRGNAAELAVRDRVSGYRPQPPSAVAAADTARQKAQSPAAPRRLSNPGVAALRDENPETVGWVTIPYTRIDYPVVQGPDNGFYLHRDIEKNDSFAGTVFMDYRSEADLSGRDTVIYGHNMKSGAMFHDLVKFDDPKFWDSVTTGWLYLPDATYRLDIFAYLVVGWDDPYIYGPSPGAWGDFLSYVKNNARYYRDLGLEPNDRVVTLSTCSYQFDHARTTIIARLTEVTEPAA